MEGELRLFIDMDGVLADFDRHYLDVFGYSSSREFDNADWDAIRKVGDFYLNIPPMVDMAQLWEFVAPYKPIVLTGVPWSVPEAADNKRAWVRSNLGPEVEVRCCRSKDKCTHASYGDILVDDWEKYRPLWENKGGIWVTHTSAETSIAQLKALGL